LVRHKQITDDAGDFFFMSAEQAFDTVVVPVGPTGIRLLDVDQFNNPRWFGRLDIENPAGSSPSPP
jgi:hypothetical protein